MEAGAFLVLVLSIHVAVLLGPWVLAIGVMRYALVAASWTAPWMRSALPTRYSAKTVAARQGSPSSRLPVRSCFSRSPSHAFLARQGRLGSSDRIRSREQPPPDPDGRKRSLREDDLTTDGGPVRMPDDDGTPPGEDTAEADKDRRRGRRVVARVVTALACLLVFVALVAPDTLGGLTAGAFLRIPVEAIVGVALVLVLPARARRPAVVLGGVVLGLLAVLKIVDIGFTAVLARPFDPLVDWSLFGAGLDFLAGSIGRIGADATVVVAVVLAVAVLFLMTTAALRLSGVVVRRRIFATRAVMVLGAAWVICALLGAQIVPDVPVASTSTAALAYDRAAQVRAGLQDEQAFAAQIAADPFRDTPADQLLTGLRGKDVVLTFVESYGRSAVENPDLAPKVDPVLDDGTRRLAAAGFGARSAFLTSSTFGGSSWLAHATFLSGLWVNNQQRYNTLVSSDRLTITSAFHRANWRTVAVQPGTTGAWPEAAFYGFDQLYDFPKLAYHGPDLGWATVPDQYILSAFQRGERADPNHPPVMAEVDTVSSHAPWPFVPPVLDWNSVGDGSVYTGLAAGAPPRDAVWAKGTPAVRDAYARSIEYAINSLVSYVQTYGDDNLVLVFLGDHQPLSLVSGDGASHDVPITIVAKDKTVLDRISGWKWQDGLKPGPHAPVWRMDGFRNRFLTAFGSQGGSIH
jgi:hypothetical protein